MFFVNNFCTLLITFAIFVINDPFVILNNKCDGAEQQYFRVQPRNITVREGAEALLDCEIVNLAGSVQWVKDGFALGFDPNIPARPRYMVVENRKFGINSLRIVNVSLEDDGEFQCQVGPSKSHKAIRANAKLTVISPPTNVEIVNYAPNAKVEIKENSLLNLECAARNARPAAEIIWYRAQVPISSQDISSNISQVQIQETEDNHGIKRYNVRSRLTIRPTSADDFSEYSCAAAHEALQERLLKTSVQLSVLYPPSAPTIEGYTEGEIIKRGQIVELVCRSRNGNPAAQLIWYKNKTQVRVHFRTKNGRQSENVLTFKATANDDQSVYRCESKNFLSKKVLKAEVVLTVLFSPVTITIIGPHEARTGENITLTCKTANSNPAAEIRCSVGGKPIKNLMAKTSSAPDGGHFTTANISVTIESGVKSLLVICHAFNRQLNEDVVGTHTIQVLHKPNAPEIEGYIRGTKLMAGDVHKFRCTSSGGNPLATLTWFKNNKRIESIFSHGNKSVTAEISVLISASDNNATYRCEAENAAIQTPFFDTITLSVQYPPEKLTIRTIPETLMPNMLAKLVCESSVSNPPIRLTWWHEKVPLLGVNETFQLSGMHDGQTSRNELTLNVSEKSNGLVYICQGTNDVFPKAIQQSIRLQVYYKPIIETISDVYTGLENGNLSIKFKVNANPTKVVYAWTKDGLSIAAHPSVGRIISNGPSLTFSKLSRNDIGVYVCTATNSQGRTIVNINVNVKYPAEIVHVTDRVVADQLSDAKFSCVADANPFDAATIQWKRDNFSDFESRTVVDLQPMNKTAILVLKKVQKYDFGLFECSAYNGLGSSVSRAALLLVNFKPELDKSLKFMKTASEVGQIGRLICRTKSFPISSYLWSRTSLPITTNNTGKYFTTFKQIDEITSESILIITHVTGSDFGEYECVSSNEFGFVTIKQTLQNISYPEAPEQLTAPNISYDSVMLRWTAGFNGGLSLLYKIRYRIRNDDEYKYENVMEENASSYTLTNLEPDTEYLISIAAINRLGSSSYTTNLLKIKTSNDIPPSYRSSSSSSSTSSSSSSLPEKLPTKVSSFVILICSSIGTILLLLNAMLVGCCLKRRSKRLSKDDGSLKAATNNKSGQIEMYASNNFNSCSAVTANAETLSSISEKSENATPESGRHNYKDDERKYNARSTYLVDRPDFMSSSYQLFAAAPAAQTATAASNTAAVSFDYEKQKTQTLPHFHNHNKFKERSTSKSKDDLNVTSNGNGRYQQYGFRSSFGPLTAVPQSSRVSPAPPSDGSYFNMAEYISYPPSLELDPHYHYQQQQQQHNHQHKINNNNGGNIHDENVVIVRSPQSPISHYGGSQTIYPQYPMGTLLKQQKQQQQRFSHAANSNITSTPLTVVPPPDVLYNTSAAGTTSTVTMTTKNGQILQPQTLLMPKNRIEFSSFGNGGGGTGSGYVFNERDNHLV